MLINSSHIYDSCKTLQCLKIVKKNTFCTANSEHAASNFQVLFGV